MVGDRRSSSTVDAYNHPSSGHELRKQASKQAGKSERAWAVSVSVTTSDQATRYLSIWRLSQPSGAHTNKHTLSLCQSHRKMFALSHESRSCARASLSLLLCRQFDRICSNVCQRTLKCSLLGPHNCSPVVAARSFAHSRFRRSVSSGKPIKSTQIWGQNLIKPHHRRERAAAAAAHWSFALELRGSLVGAKKKGGGNERWGGSGEGGRPGMRRGREEGSLQRTFAASTIRRRQPLALCAGRRRQEEW